MKIGFIGNFSLDGQNISHGLADTHFLSSFPDGGELT